MRRPGKWGQVNAALRKCEAHAQAGQYRLAIDDAGDVARECLRYTRGRGTSQGEVLAALAESMSDALARASAETGGTRTGASKDRETIARTEARTYAAAIRAEIAREGTTSAAAKRDRPDRETLLLRDILRTILRTNRRIERITRAA